MTRINPLAGSLVQVSQVPRPQAGVEIGAIRPTRPIGRVVAAGEDTFEHRVENTGEVAAVGDRQPQQQPKPAAKTKPEESSRLNLLA